MSSHRLDAAPGFEAPEEKDGRKGLRAAAVSPESSARASTSIQAAGFLF
jgi:hypothetical protein